MSNLLDNLNPAQRAAVENYDSPSLIVAGAGSGKTRVLTCRIAYMLSQGVAPDSVLALTFTNKAAREMRERISSLVGEATARWLWMGTFHSVFCRILRNEAERLGYPASFTIYDTADSRNLVKNIVKEMNLSDETYKPNEIYARISLAKNNLVTPQSYEGNAVLTGEDRERRRPQFAEVYKTYARRCKEYGAMDFDDLLLNINILFRDHPDVLAKYQRRFRYILVDEYQDTNYAQYIIIRRLAEQHSNVCVVGDDAQSIYSFRGAKIENILRFRNDFPGAKTFKLEQNYRSTQTIVNAANSIIRHNTRQIPKECFATGEAGERIKVVKAYTDREEGELVVDEIRRLKRQTGDEWSGFAVLYRTNSQSRILEEALRRRDVPYRIYGGTSFYQRQEVKDLLAYFRLVVNPLDDDAFRRVVNYPSRGIGDVTVARIAELAARDGVSMWEAVDRLPEDSTELRTAAKKVKGFVELIRSFSLGRNEKGLYELGLDIATRSGIIGGYKMKQTPEATSALDNIEELLNSMLLFREQRSQLTYGGQTEETDEEPTLDEWLQNIALLTDMDKEEGASKDHVTLMTVHAAKGLEFDHIFIVGLEENLFPGLLSVSSEEGIEEERRLFYVALTRARSSVMLSFCESRFKWGNMKFCRPSRFLAEIDQQYLDVSCALDEEAEGEGLRERQQPMHRTFDRRRCESRDYGESGRPQFSRSGYGGRGAGSDARFGSDRSGGGRPGAGVPAPGVSQGRGSAPARNVVPAPGAGFRSMGLRRQAGTPAAASPAEAPVPTPAASAAPSSGGYAVGVRVRHARFGTGVVEQVATASDGDSKLTVRFLDPGIGRKTLLSKFARLEIIG